MSQGLGFICCSHGHRAAEQGAGAGRRGKVDEGTRGQLRGAGTREQPRMLVPGGQSPPPPRPAPTGR